MSLRLQLTLLQLQLVVVVVLLLLGHCWGRAHPQNPFEKIAVGALGVGSQIMNSLQEGAKASQQLNFDNALMAVHSKTDVGYGDAMRGNVDDSDSSESDERRRRRRRRRSANSLLSRHLALHRHKRSPCMMMGATTESPDEVEARRRRARKRAANNASRTRINKSSSKKKKLLEAAERRRRQAPQQDQQQGQLGPQQGPSLGERVKYFWLSIVDNVADAVQQMRQRIKGAAAQAADGMQSM
ncbi:PREDICTED: uncharacterized protein LOC108620211 [Drosophila arizonae]|uniref:Uncharacterized protein LOC108620211 n=1 Tax=Drosophila arizonae TaxID=7263 RepID=A0ABM1PZG4_DROAR|nr:PREDICTED: uncharacterized protein LOC108620211 [Drosophila arizonae]